MSSDKLNVSDELTKVTKLLESACKELASRKAPESPDDKYTVFTALNSERDEDMTHTAFLYGLLNGNHDLKDSFLSKFFEKVLGEDEQIRSKVYKQYYIPKIKGNYGIMDLYIESKEACYPIEVKIFAKDQDRQIERYYRFAKDQNKTKFKVFYLTLNGRSPSDMSRGKLEPDNESIKCISFADNIYDWLIECAKIAEEKKSFGIQNAINQYKTLIEKLTGAEQEDESMDAIRKLIASSKDNYLSAVKIAQNINKVRIDKLQQLLKDLYDYIEDAWHFQGYMDEPSKFENYYTRNNKTWMYEGPGFSFVLKELENKKLTVYFRFEVDGDLEYGVQFLGSSREWCPKKYKKIRDAFPSEQWQKIIDNHEDKDNCWLWWNDLRGVLDADFVDCCNDDYVQLFDPRSYEEKLNKIKEVINANMQNIINNGIPNEEPHHLM